MTEKQAVPLWRQLQQAISVVEQVASGRSATDALLAVPADLRPAAQALAFQVWRNYGRALGLATGLATKTPQSWVHAALHSGLALLADPQQRGYDDFTLVNQLVEAVKRRAATKHQAPFINACLRRYVREGQALDRMCEGDPQARWNFPKWWIQRVQRDHPQTWEHILEASNHPGPMTLRVNQRRMAPSHYLEQLAAAGISAKRQGVSAVILQKPVPVHQLPGFLQGAVSVQDAGAQRAAEMILDGFAHSASTRILDACAAPGGKTGHLLEMSDAQVVALELDGKRAKRITENLDRLQLHAEVRCSSALEPQTWWDGRQFDLILLDAPCTASGIVRRHPDVRWLRRESDIATLAGIQRQMQDTLWPLLKIGGRLLYCTCSIFAEEGLQQQLAFLERNKDAALLPAPGHLLPSGAAEIGSVADNERLDHDGFFYALFQKTAA
ncbi:MAG: 16S rRNA (cytosine(967)-C(5))-methyltransferase RsmB [Rhodoferax sp.]|nr:MAG: 16S rRNA (cytosine(967)-C(5))-methyltransferase RsmB [Rhodoferax sp.]